ncbi:MAG: alanine racemase [Candidatus Omnitrophica bacterium]|nr:alanine racemase [Candidatus Omnitrophota bacterium]
MTITLPTSRLMEHGTWLEIRLDHLRYNLKAVEKASGRKNEVLAVVKANAYGHGLLETAKTLDGQVRYLGVSSLLEALDLKEHGIATPVFLFGRLTPAELPIALAEEITLSVSSYEEAEELASISQSLKRLTKIHIKVDTGMGRLGIPVLQASGTIEKIHELPSLVPEGIYTHFPSAESDQPFTEEQLQRFAFLLEDLGKKGIHFVYRHAANSAGSLKIRTPVLNLIRPGLMLYGLYSDESLRKDVQVKPILSLKSRIILLKKLTPGQSVGYGRTYIAKTHTLIATLPVGYSHGYPYSAFQKAQVLYKGKRYPLAGRISMDYLSFDLGPDSAKIGDEVTLIGPDGKEEIRTEEVAGWAGTIPYEIVTRLTSKLPRYYRS